MELPLENYTVGDIEVEEDYQNFLKELFKTKGWRAIDEVKPAGTEFSADLLVEHDTYGWFGIETKMANYGGGVPAEAHHQIVMKYRARKYLARTIDRWVYAPFYKYAPEADGYVVSDPARHRWLRESFCVFFNHHGIGYLCPDRWQMLFEDVDVNYRIDILDDENTGEIEMINKKVQHQMEEFPYKRL